jgi:hypothetical protein
MELVQATSKTCRHCLEANLVDEVKLARCSQCNAVYCIHFASNIDPTLCIECLSDVSLHKEVVTKTYVHESYDEETDTLNTTEYKRKARSIKLEGLDWLFAQRKIVSMSDESLELAIEYHREILNGMLSEREQRKAEYMHRFASVKTVYPTTVDGATSASTTVKRTRTISSNKAAATANGLLQSMQAGGMNAAQILQMLEKIAATQGIKK